MAGDNIYFKFLKVHAKKSLNLKPSGPTPSKSYIHLEHSKDFKTQTSQRNTHCCQNKAKPLNPNLNHFLNPINLNPITPSPTEQQKALDEKRDSLVRIGSLPETSSSLAVSSTHLYLDLGFRVWASENWVLRFGFGA